MEWLDHFARISNDHLPKNCFFGWLRKTRPSGGLHEEEMERCGAEGLETFENQ